MFGNFTSRLMSPLSKDETGHGSSYFTWNSPDKPSWLSGRHYGSGTPPPPQIRNMDNMKAPMRQHKHGQSQGGPWL